MSSTSQTQQRSYQSPASAGAKQDPAGTAWTLPFAAVDRTSLPLVGGKGANLGELVKAGFAVPPGFCVTTAAYDRVASGAALATVLDTLDRAGDLDAGQLAALAGAARNALLSAPMPREIEDAVRGAYARLCPDSSPIDVAVRSSATAEDLPDASFAGQQDTYLNIHGADAVVDAVRRCWASLWTERAVAYRTSNMIDHRAASLSAVVQLMVPATISGVLFTANPLTNRRHEAVIDAAPGLGERLVSGAVNPDHYVVDTRTRTISERTVARELTDGLANGRTASEASIMASLTDDHLRRLADVGAAVESHFDAPQDIEWAMDAAGHLWLLQARPITTLFPEIAASPASSHPLRVFFSFNVAQGVLQPLTPMGIEFFRQIGAAVGALAGIGSDPVAGPPAIAVAAERMYLEVTPVLRTRWGGKIVSTMLGRMEPRTGEIIQGLLADPRLAPLASSKGVIARRVLGLLRRTWFPLRAAYSFLRPAHARERATVSARALLTASAQPAGTPQQALDMAQWLMRQAPRRVVVPIAPSALVVGVGSLFAATALARAVGAEEDVALITGGLPHNPTTEMNLCLWDISRRVRRDPASATLLGTIPARELAARYLAGDLPAPLQHEVADFLRVYGFRGVAEIDLGVPRWNDDPTHVFGVLSNYLRLPDGDMAPDAQFRRAAAEADAAMARILARARAAGLRGRARALLLRILFRRMRELLGSRESPKFYLVALAGRCRSLLKQAGTALVEAGRLEQRDDIFFLTFAEARAGLRGQDQRALVRERRAVYEREMQRRRIPRVILSDGTTLYGENIAQDLSGDTLTGTPASPGVYSGIARVIMEPAGARLEPGEILVAPSTDPGWTPLFMTAGALVMEMGGMMSHGSVVAREYGIPAVVGAIGATASIQSGQWITVDGGRGVVAIADARPAEIGAPEVAA